MLSVQIRQYRHKNKMSKAMLSRVTGLSPRTIEFLEKGKMKNPTLKTLKALSKAFDVDIEDLIK